eukprot:10109052-Alexandrium_andersonii.AAC.1
MAGLLLGPVWLDDGLLKGTSASLFNAIGAEDASSTNAAKLVDAEDDEDAPGAQVGAGIEAGPPSASLQSLRIPCSTGSSCESL